MYGPRHRALAAFAVAALGVIGAALAQDPPANPPANNKAAPAAKDKAARKPGLRAGGGAAPETAERRPGRGRRGRGSGRPDPFQAQDHRPRRHAAGRPLLSVAARAERAGGHAGA